MKASWEWSACKTNARNRSELAKCPQQSQRFITGPLLAYCVLLCANCVKRSITALHTVSNALLIECLQLTISYSQWAHSSSTHSKTTEHTVNCVLFTVCLRSKLCYSAVDRLVSVTIIFKYLKVILSTLDLTNCLQNHTINRRPESRPHPMSMSMSMSTLK